MSGPSSNKVKPFNDKESTQVGMVVVGKLEGENVMKENAFSQKFSPKEDIVDVKKLTSGIESSHSSDESVESKSQSQSIDQIN